MKKREPVRHIMTHQPFSLQINKGLHEAEKLFKKHKIRHLPVVEGDQIKGVLSLTDLKRISFVDAYDPNEDTLDPSVYSLFTLDQVMVSNTVTVDPNTPILEVAELFSKSEFHSAPVVEDGILVGIVTTTDLIRFLIDQY